MNALRFWAGIAMLAMITPGCTRDGGHAPVSSPSASVPASQPPTAAAPAKPDPAMNDLPAIDASPYAGPAASVRVLHMESFPVQHAASVEVNTPTGGWTLTRDHAAVIDGIAKLFYTLEKPAGDEMVTQAFMTLRNRFVSTDPAFEHAEVYIHSAQRGISTLTTNYRLAARE